MILDSPTLAAVATLNFSIEPGDCGYAALLRDDLAAAVEWYKAKYAEGQQMRKAGYPYEDFRPLAWRQGWQSA